MCRPPGEGVVGAFVTGRKLRRARHGGGGEERPGRSGRKHPLLPPHASGGGFSSPFHRYPQINALCLVVPIVCPCWLCWCCPRRVIGQACMTHHCCVRQLESAYWPGVSKQAGQQARRTRPLGEHRPGYPIGTPCVANGRGSSLRCPFPPSTSVVQPHCMKKCSGRTRQARQDRHFVDKAIEWHAHDRSHDDVHVSCQAIIPDRSRSSSQVPPFTAAKPREIDM